MLPQWLREVRQQARDSSEDEPEQVPAEEEAASPVEATPTCRNLQPVKNPPIYWLVCNPKRKVKKKLQIGWLACAVKHQTKKMTCQR